MLFKLAMITKVTSTGTKYRLILDCSASGTNSNTRQWEIILLPRVTDVVDDVLAQMAGASSDMEVSLFVLDFSDAFFRVPTAPSERKYFVAKIQGK